MPLDAIPRHIGLSDMDVEMLAGLSEGYFQGKNNVVQLARLRVAPSDTGVEKVLSSPVVLPFRSPLKN
jgi:hypothetical protein